MVVVPPADAYLKMISYGEQKSQLRSDQLALQSFIAGYWIALYGHAITDFVGSFYLPDDPVRSGIAKGLYGLLFPGAFMALIYTGAELYTGNTVTMVLLVLHHGKKAVKDMIRVWLLSLVGNYVGVVFGAYFFTRLSNVFTNNSPGQVYLHSVALAKIGRDWGSNLILAVGCNSLVCLATWCVICSQDGAGKILAIFYCISIFVIGGYEHIIFNMYLLSAASFTGFSVYNYGEIFTRNFIPVYIGNMIAGCIMTGIMWWYALHPRYTDLAPYSDLELLRELSLRQQSKSGQALEDQILIQNNPSPNDGKSTYKLNKQNSLWKRNGVKSEHNRGWFQSVFSTPHVKPANKSNLLARNYLTADNTKTNNSDGRSDPQPISKDEEAIEMPR